MTLPAARLQGHRVLVVGGGTRPTSDPEAPWGNGRAIAVRAAQEGASVAVSDRDGGSAETTAGLVRAAGGDAHVVVADIATAEGCDRTVGEAVNALGGLDALVLNAGIGAGRGLGETSADEWDLVFAVNLRAQFLLLKAALPLMSNGGAAVLVSSIAGLQPGSNIPAYDASKAGQIGLARHAAREGARRGIRVNTVAPGLIDTPLGRVATAGRPSRASTRIPLGRQGTAHEVAAAVVWLLSDDAGYVTGQVLAVDGGLSTLA